MVEKLFTREEAEALLPTLTPLLEELRDAKRAIDAHQSELTALLAKTLGNGHRLEHERIAVLREQTRTLNRRVRELVQTVTLHGCEIKDLEAGLIDFRCQREGRVVYLCWRLGEGRIDFWHDLDTGFAGRQPL